MKIKKASASFGRLNGDTIEFGGGLNIVQAPNESGKSTWCAFLRAMFYGINTSERDKAGFISDKTKYQPWSGSAMEGTMDIVSGGKDITIQRTALGRAPMKNFTAVYTGTDIPVPGLNGDNAGASLIGVTGPVFERSAFIRQSGVRISQNTELEKRINSIVSSGDETVSYTEVDAKLRTWLRRRKYNNTGSIPALQARLKDTESSINALKADAAESARLRGDTAELSRSKALLETELESYKILEKIAEQENVIKSRENAEAAEAEAKDAEAALSEFGSSDDSRLNSIRGELSALESFRSIAESSDSALDEAERKMQDARLRVNDSVFSGITPEKAGELSDASEQAERSARKKRRAASIMTVIFLVLAAASAASGFFTSPPVSYVLWALAAVLVVSTVAVNISAGKAAALYKRSLSAYGMSGTEEFRRKVQNYREACSSLSDAENACESARTARDSNRAALDSRISALIADAKSVHPGVNDISDILPCLDEIDVAKRRHRELESRAQIARGLSDSLEKSVDMTPVSAPEQMPRYTKSHTLAMLNDVSRRLDNAKAAYNMTLGRMRAVGDPLVLEGECRSITEELELQTAQYDAISLAISALKEADTEIQTRFAPVLARTAGNIFHRLTGGKYDMLAFDRTLDAAVQAHGDTVSRNVLSLSEGTSNQVYLALRIAVCLLATPGDDPCPIILDDALVSFDDERMGYALDYLKELSESRQVILFTCHSREREYFHGDSGVTAVNMA